jgi:hypothetical protein
MKYILFSTAFVLIFGYADAQKMKATAVPAPVKAKFASLYPNVKSAKWEKEGANYEAEFDVNEVETSASFDATGNLVETETAIATTVLPAKVTSYMTANVPGKKITEASKIVDAAGKVTYEAEAGGMDYIFDETGNFIKSVKAD